MCLALSGFAPACYSGAGAASGTAGSGGSDSADEGSADESGSDTGPDGNDVPLDCELGAKAKLRLLTRAELDGSLEAVFGITDPVATGLLPADPKVNGYVGSAEAGRMTDVQLEQILAVALIAGETVTADLSAHMPCASDDPSADCARSFVESTLPLLYRRPRCQSARCTLRPLRLLRRPWRAAARAHSPA